MTTKLFYIGDKFYSESGTMMSSLYEEGTRARYDWGFVNRDLRSGISVEIRPATEEELVWAEKKLEKFKE